MLVLKYSFYAILLLLLDRHAYAGGRRCSCFICPRPRGERVARSAYHTIDHTELFLRWPLHLSISLYYYSKGHLQVHVNLHLSYLLNGHFLTLWRPGSKHLSWGKPPDPHNLSMEISPPPALGMRRHIRALNWSFQTTGGRRVLILVTTNLHHL